MAIGGDRVMGLMGGTYMMIIEAVPEQRDAAHLAALVPVSWVLWLARAYDWIYDIN